MAKVRAQSILVLDLRSPLWEMNEKNWTLLTNVVRISWDDPSAKAIVIFFCMTVWPTFEALDYFSCM